ncbi:MAG TPA: response regulator [Candidatus Paceibacterota bacterium]|nr:response regulator [Candidatus Paceibacterota bacterium]
MGTEPKKILIVDDDSFLLDMYALKFSKSNFDVSTALGSLPALEKLKQGFSPEIILIDITMPHMDGFELLAKIREQNLSNDSSIIFLSNRGQPSEINQIESLGVAGYIVKASTTPGEVIDKVVNIINKIKE